MLAVTPPPVLVTRSSITDPSDHCITLTCSVLEILMNRICTTTVSLVSSEESRHLAGWKGSPPGGSGSSGPGAPSVSCPPHPSVPTTRCTWHMIRSSISVPRAVPAMARTTAPATATMPRYSTAPWPPSRPARPPARSRPAPPTRTPCPPARRLPVRCRDGRRRPGPTGRAREPIPVPGGAQDRASVAVPVRAAGPSRAPSCGRPPPPSAPPARRGLHRPGRERAPAGPRRARKRGPTAPAPTV